ncbi:MAG: hypothetical protein PHH85_11050, partial [Candidatus Methanoperedens sp.]|nr:hypothetical protein [Candidatus Methanoperedens sp.]
MPNIRETVGKFLAEFTSPKEKDIEDLISFVAISNPSLDKDSFRESILITIKQRDILKTYEKDLFSLPRNLPGYSELESALKEAKEGHDNLEDVEEELNNIGKILTSLKTKLKIENPLSEKPAESQKTDLETKLAPELQEAGKPVVETSVESQKTDLETKLAPEPQEAGKPVVETSVESQKTDLETKLAPEPQEAGKPVVETSVESQKTDLETKLAPEPQEAEKPVAEAPVESQKIELKTEVEPSKSTEASIPQLEATEGITGAVLEEGQELPESLEAIMRRLDRDDTKTLLKDRLTPEKQAVFQLLEEKLMSDVESRINKLKDIQTRVLEEEKPKTFFGKITTFFTKETETIEAYDISIHGPLVTFDGLEGFNEIERYWVNEPYAFIVILFDPENNTYLYYAVEPVLTDFEDLFLKEIKDRLKDVLLVETVQREEDKKKILTSKV